MHLKNKKRILIYLVIFCVLCSSLSACGITVTRPDDPVHERNIENLNDLQDSGENQTQSEFPNAAESITEDTGLTSEDSATDGNDNNFDSGFEEKDISEEENDEYPLSETHEDINTGSYQDLVFFSEEELNACAATNVGRFAYERLKPEEKKIYNEMNLALKDMYAGVNLDCFDEDEINKIFVCVMTDHPEIFWTTGYVCSRYTRGEEVEAVGFRGTFPIDKATVDSRQPLIDDYVNKCLAGMPQGDDYSKIKYVYEYIISHTEYDLNAPDNQNICSVFIGGRSVCQGYAKATQYLLGKAGIMCTLVSGVTGNNENHAWNLVSADNAYYYVDTTWGDASYQNLGDTSVYIPPISYDYLCVTTEELLKTHTPQNVVDLPLCGSYKDNYYVREGTYFTSLDTALLASAFDRYQSEGRDTITLKCSDANVYSALKDYLINSQNIFDYIHGGDNSISYWESPNESSISFRLTP